MPSAIAEKRFAAAATTLQQVAVDCKTAKHLQDAMEYLVTPILLAPEKITEAWKRDPEHPMFKMATANKLRYNSITGPLRMIYYQAMFVAAAVNQQLADRAGGGDVWSNLYQGGEMVQTMEVIESGLRMKTKLSADSMPVLISFHQLGEESGMPSQSTQVSLPLWMSRSIRRRAKSLFLRE